MKRILFMVLAGSVVMPSACRKDQLQPYDGPATVYFDLTGAQRDSLVYTFAYEPSRAADTMYLPVKLSGKREARARKFIIHVDPDSTTAVAGRHYKALEDSYTLAPDSGTCYVPVILYNTDTLLERQSVRIKFVLYPTPDLDTALVGLTVGRLVFSSKLERPDWWGMWMGDYYSQVKHELFIITTGQTTLTTGSAGGLDAPKNLYFISLLTSFLNDPAAWITRNPDAGYKLTQESDGNYYFFNQANPDKKILYRYDAQAGKYFFIDENGLEVN